MKRWHANIEEIFPFFFRVTFILKVLPSLQLYPVKFIYFEKATQFCEIFTLLLSTVHTDKSKVNILQNCVAFSDYMNFTNLNFPVPHCAIYLNFL